MLVRSPDDHNQGCARLTLGASLGLQGPTLGLRTSAFPVKQAGWSPWDASIWGSSFTHWTMTWPPGYRASVGTSECKLTAK